MAEGQQPVKFKKYRYEPSLSAAIIFTIVFALTTLFHIFQCYRKRAWFLIAFIIGGLFECVGYIGRIQSSKDQDAKGPFIQQTLLLLLGPALFAASIYMILGRVILLTEGEPYSIVRRTWLTKIFVTGDVLSFAIQGAGGGIMAGADGDKDKMDMGEQVIIGGLFVQLIFFGLFIVAAAVFQIRGRVHLQKFTAAQNMPWKKHLYTLYAVSVLILIRSVFRVIEYIQGNDGYLLRHEVFLYIFDAVLMAAVMVLMNVVHPGEIAIMLKEKNVRGSLVELN